MTSSQTNEPRFISITPRFACQDLEHALAFYGRLGFQTSYQDEGFAIITRDGIDLQLNYSPDPPEGHSICLIGVTNIDVLYEQYLATPAVRSPLEVNAWGGKGFFICDPSRNLIIFEERISEEETGAGQESE